MANTRKLLEKLPEEKLGWEAHEKSNSIGWNIAHLINVPTWLKDIVELGQFDETGQEPPRVDLSKAEFLKLFDENVAIGRVALTDVEDEEFQKP